VAINRFGGVVYLVVSSPRATNMGREIESGIDRAVALKMRLNYHNIDPFRFSIFVGFIEPHYIQQHPSYR
jgi:hypothetical protein